MRIGMRWSAGQPPHPQVPQELCEAISWVDRRAPVDTSWTLTWLEGRPRCERGDGYRVVLGSSNEVDILAPGDDEPYDDDEDDWLRE